MSVSNSDVKAIKKSSFSCEPCRRRKVKCGGEQPRCSRCSARNDNCVYKLGPTLSYTQKLEKRIVELEAALIQIQTAGSPSRDAIASARPEWAINPAPSKHQIIPEIRRAFEGLKLDEKGGITFHGPTSFFQLPGDDPTEESSNEKSQFSDIAEDAPGKRERLVTNAWQQRILETLADIPEPFQHLLQSHWCWIHPLFNFVYRPAFTRDMELLGPYYSHMLLNAMLSHSVRWCKSDPSIRDSLVPYDDGNLFARQARTLLQEDLMQGHSKIPTIQTLLLLSAQESGRGNRTQAWLYSGMAFRLVEDIGINIDSQRYAGSVELSDEDIEIRRRLFWSCYFYDKMISLYLGRSPSIQHSYVSPPQIMLDDSAENDSWSPYGITYPDGMEYPPTQAHSISCFMQMCQLSVILNQILIHIYNPFQQSTETEVERCLEREGQALKTFWEELHTFLRIDPKNLPQYCPPSHIVTLNCLYHTFKILLYRPMLFRRSSASGGQGPNSEHLLECITSATSIIAIFDLFCRSFGDGHCVLALSYSVYTAASIFLLQIQASTAHLTQAFKHLDFCIRSLNSVKTTNPVIGSAISLITQELSKLDPTTIPSYMHREPFFETGQRSADNHNKSTIPSIKNDSISTESAPFLSNSTYQIPTGWDFNMDDFEITPEMFEIFNSLEPISSTVGPVEDFM